MKGYLGTMKKSNKLILISSVIIASLAILFIFFTHQKSQITNNKSQITNNKLRIISLAPAITEILFALGLDNEIIGVTTFCDYPQQALTKQKVGTFSEPNLETIIELRPDIVFATDLEQAPTVAKLKTLRVNVQISSPTTMAELYDSIIKIGQLTSREEQANKLVAEMLSTVERIRNKTALIPEQNKPKVFVEIGHRPLFTAGKGSFIDELITLAGGINIAHDIPRPYSYYNAEQVVQRRPDIIIISGMLKENTPATVKNRLGWDKIPAVKNGRVYNDIDQNLFLRPGPRLVEGLVEIHKRL